MNPSSYLDSFIVDDLENLSGLWDPYPFGHGGDEVVDDLEVTADEPGAAIEDVRDAAGSRRKNFQLCLSRFRLHPLDPPGVRPIGLAPASSFATPFFCTLCCLYFSMKTIILFLTFIFVSRVYFQCSTLVSAT